MGRHAWSKDIVTFAYVCTCGASVMPREVDAVLNDRALLSAPPGCREAFKAYANQPRCVTEPGTPIAHLGVDHGTKPSNVNIVMGDVFADTSPREYARRVRAELDAMPPCTGRPQGGFRDTMIKGNLPGEPPVEYVGPMVTGTPPRFQVRPASEMREGEPYVDSADHPADEWNPCQLATAYEDVRAYRYSREADSMWSTFVIDTHSPEWKAFDKERRERESGMKVTVTHCDTTTVRFKMEAVEPRVYPSPKGTPPISTVRVWERPSDTEIVAAYEAIVQQETAYLSPMERIKVGSCMVEVADVYAARSRELKRKAAEAREQERQRVVCEGTLAEDY